MTLTTKTTYTDDLINKAGALYWKEVFATPFYLSLGGVLVALILVFYFDSKTWISGTFLAVSLISMAVFFFSYYVVKNRSMAVYMEMETPIVHWKFNDKGISARSDVGASEFKWKLLKGIVKSNELWLFVYKNNSYSTFPLAGVSDEVLDFLSKKVIEKGGNVK